MNVPPLNIDYVASLPTLNDVIRRAVDGTNLNGTNSLILSDLGGTSHHCALGALYDQGTGNWILVLTPVN